MKLPDNWTYRVSLFCGILPLVIGLTIFFSWQATRRSWLEMAGLYTLLGGLVLFIAGLIALLAWVVRAKKSGIPRRNWVILSSGILLVNFPVAVAIIWSVGVIQSTYYLTIKNNTAFVLSEIHLVGRGYDLTIGAIQPGESRKLKLHPDVSGETSLDLQARCRDNRFTNIVEAYFEGGYGGRAVVTVNEDGRRVHVENP